MNPGRIFGVILAGGSGTRMGNMLKPKQFLTIKGKPIIIITLEKMMGIAEFSSLYLAIRKDWIEYFHRLLDQWNIRDGRIRVAPGGDDRMGSLENVLAAIKDHEGVGDDDIVLVNDAVRPFVSREVLLDSIKGAKKHGAVFSTLPAIHQMAVLEDEGSIIEIPKRQKTFKIMAPESFNLRLIMDTFSRMSDDERQYITSLTQLCFLKGVKIFATKGGRNNIKITTGIDMLIAPYLLEQEE
jgi:2-C-methyl-D-erythritol 4-phosphate cytidylyltransferase